MTTATVICAECGEVIEVKNIEALLLALHLTNECEKRWLIRGVRAGDEED